MQHIIKDKGVANLVLLMTFMCFFIGFIQTLMIPMIVPIGSVKTVGFMESVSEIGLMLIIAGVLMVVVALVLGSRKSIRAIEVVNREHEPKNVEE